jgi:glycosyltransferase involved in cell wall biosynthesis
LGPEFNQVGTSRINTSTRLPKTFSVIIPAWNESSHIQATLHAVQDALSHQVFTGDVIVVDNNSTDDTAEKALSLGARVVFEPINQIARARNAGAAASESDWLVFLDADSLINSELLISSLNALASGHVLGGGSTVKLDRDVGMLPKTVLGFWNWWSLKSRTAAGCYIYCTKEAFDAVGAFDERQYAAEELYLSKKFRKLSKQRGQKFVIQANAPITTSARKIDWYSPQQFLKQVLFLLVPGATRSRKMCGLWYDRSEIVSVRKNAADKTDV